MAEGCVELPVVAENGMSKNGPVRLAGSVWMPADVPPRGLVLMHPGSGPSDRDNDVLFPPIRAALLATGAAVCSFDKRGVGDSSGDWRDAGIEGQADDLESELAAVRQVVTDVAVGLFGHSQGGWVVLEASRRVNPSFVITNSGPSVSPFVQEEHSTCNRLRAAGWPEAELDAGVALFHEVMDLALAGVPFTEAQCWVAQQGHESRLRALTDAGVFVPDSEQLWSHAGALVGYDPRRALDELSVPLLALFGALDAVVPVTGCVDRLRRHVRRDLLEVVVVAGADHRLQSAGSDEFAPGYLSSLIGFVSAHLARSGDDQ